MIAPARQRALWVVVDRAVRRLARRGRGAQPLDRRALRSGRPLLMVPPGMGSGWRNPRSGAASTSCIRARPSTPGSSTSCRRWRRWAPRSPWRTSTATAGRISTSPTAAKAALNRLYRNKGDGTFVDVAPEMGLADVNRAGTGVSMGAVWGDYDNDGFEDLFLYKYGRPELFRNDGGRAFVARVGARGPARAGSTPTAPSGWTTTATAGSTSSSRATGPRTSTSGT